MIILKATSESLQITTSTAAAIDFSVSYADITTTTFSPSSNEGKISSATTTAVLAAPASSTQRQVKLITISNHDASLSDAIVVQKLITSTTYNMTPTITLLPGETAQYMDGTGWVYYSATGSVKGSQTAAGSTTQIQFNNGGVLNGDTDLTWNWSTNTLALGTNPQISLSGVTAAPTAPAASTLLVYSQAVSGKMQLMKVGPAGDNEPLQAALWQNNVVYWSPNAVSGTTGGIWQGTSGTISGGSNAIVLPTTTNIYTTERRTKIPDTATTNYQTGIATEKMFFRGASAGMGGFLFVCRFGIETYVASTSRLFVGLSATAAAPGSTAADVSGSIASTVGFGYNAGDTALTFMHVDGSTLVKESISGQPALAANNGYDAYIYCKPNDTVVYYRLDNVNTGVTLVDSSITLNLPVNTTMMAAMATMSTTVATAGTIAIGVNRMYVETNR